MIATLPPDRSLPALPALLDEASVIALLTAGLERSAGWLIAGCRPKYVRYKPETSCLVQYDMTIGDGHERCITVDAHIRVFVDDRAQRRAESGKMRRVLERSARQLRNIPCTALAHLPDVNGVVQVYPVDYDLRDLSRVADASSAAHELRRAHPAFSDCDVTTEPELIRYKPERKALLRYRLRDAPVETMYGKVGSVKNVELLRKQTGALIEAGVPTPPILVSVPKRGFAWQEEATGTQLASLRGTAEYVEWMEPLAQTLASLHDARLPEARVHTLAHEMSAVNATATLLGRIVPHLASRLDQLNDDLTSQLLGMDEQFATCHGDFYDDQALVGDAGVVIIDLDEMRRGHPLLDIGNMLAHLTSGAARGDDVAEAREAFLATSLRLASHSPSDVALFEAVALLKLAPGPFRRLEPDWPSGIERILGLAESRFAESQLAISPPPIGQPAGSVPAPAPQRGPQHLLTDPAMPQLATLQNPAVMSDRLTEAFGNGQVSVDSIDIVRHKAGRRALLRYGVHKGGAARGTPEHLFGKTFVSNRGARVYNITKSITTTQAFGPEVALPEPIAFLPDERLLVQRAVAGESIEAVLLDGDLEIVRSVATALHCFHHSGLELGRTHDLAKELSPLNLRAEQICAEHPELADRAQSLLSRVHRRGANDFPWRHRPVHRDFYHDQVLEDGERIAVLDLDDASMSEPAVDVANFAAHLTLLGAQKRAYAAALAPLQRAFVVRYRELDPDLDRELLRFLMASTLLRLAGIHAPRTNGRFVATSLLAAADGLLASRTALPA